MADILEILEAIQNVAITAAAITTAIVAVKGLSAWRLKMRGSTEYDLARRCLRGAYRVREAIRALRNPVMTGGEQDQAIKESGGEGTAAESDGFAAAYDRRWQKVSDELADLWVDLIEAEVIWPKLRDASMPLRGCIGELRGQLELYLYDRKSANDPVLGRSPLSPEVRKDAFEVVFYQGDDDKFDLRLRRAVENLEAILAVSVRRGA